MKPVAKRLSKASSRRSIRPGGHTVWAVVAILGLTIPLSATTFTVDASIIDVERLEVVSNDPAQCVTPRHTLGRFLHSDLCDASPPTAATFRYRVTYEWDDRVYEKVIDRAPGTTIPLRLELD